jgi:hypothetical protein
MAPRLLAAMGSGKRYHTAHEMQCASGIAPVTAASGRTRIIQFRRACPKFRRAGSQAGGGPPPAETASRFPRGKVMGRRSIYLMNG